MTNLSASLVLLALLGACSSPEKSAAPGPVASAAPVTAPMPAETEIAPRLLRRFQPLKETFAAGGGPPSEAKVRLGAQLYRDARLSKTGKISCNDCHRLDAYGVDGTSTSTGATGVRGERNSPTVYNAAGSFVQFWDGRAANVEEQAKDPILNPIEMGMPSAATVVAVVKAIPGYATEFAEAFPGETDPVTYDNLGRAIGAFERKLLTPGRWDKFLAGEKNALTPAEREGLKTFLNVGCMVCHTGPLLGASTYERLGAVEPWPNQSDPGRGGVTHAAGDRMMFKVPTLRNIEHTAPYFHDASAPTLEVAVKMMGRHQLGIELTDIETASIVTWLKSLTGELPKEYIAMPELPSNGR